MEVFLPYGEAERELNQKLKDEKIAQGKAQAGVLSAQRGSLPLKMLLLPPQQVNLAEIGGILSCAVPMACGPISLLWWSMISPCK
ncbi:MAG: hypothetical protein R2865_16255 [Deinococcales bacterium]